MNRGYWLFAASCLMAAARSSDVLAQNSAPAPAVAVTPGSNSAPAAATNVPAATPASSPTRLTEVVVTARKTTENIQKAPASIVAVSGAQLEQAGVTSPQRLDKLLPSANLRSEGAVVEAFIRGVGTNVDNPDISAGVAFVYNGIVIPRYGTKGLLFDVNNVQVISGPQGTLYGGSAAGGAININSTQPANNYSGEAFVEGGNYSTAVVNVGQNVPLGDKVSLRADIDYHHHYGYDTGFDAENKLEGRLSLLAKPTSDVTALFFFSGSHDNGTPPTTINKPFLDRSNPWFVPPTGALYGNPFSTSLTHQDAETYIVGANIEWRVGGGTLTYIPGYVRVIDDYQQFDGALPLASRDRENQHSEELRWSQGFGKLKLSAGVFYLFDKVDFIVNLAAPVLPAPPFLAEIPVYNAPYQANTSYAVYGQGVYSVTDRLRLTVGARYTNDQIKAYGQGAVGQAFLPYTFNHSQDHPDFKVGVDYDLEPRVLVYANVQTGYIPFGYAYVPSTATQSNYTPESRLLGFSAGFKSRFFDNRLEVNSEGYYYDYLNFQAVNFNGATGITSNVPAQRSTIYGDEISVRILLPDSVEFDTGMNFMSAHYDEFTGPGYDYSGNQMVDAPVANVNAGLQKDVPFLQLGSLRGRVQTHYESGHWGVYSNGPDTHQGAYTKTDLNLTFRPNTGPWSVEGYVDNIENQPVYGAIAFGGQPGPATGFLEPPRTYGVRFRSSW